MVQYRRALMRRDISNSAPATKWFMSCEAPPYSILKLLGTHTCSAHVCSSSNCRRDQHIASLPSLPPRSWQTWKGLPGLGTMVTDAPFTRWLLRWVFGAEQCSLNRGSIPLPSIMECSLFSYLVSRPPSPTSHSLRGMTALSCQSSPLFQDGSQPWRWHLRQPASATTSHLWSYDLWFHACLFSFSQEVEVECEKNLNQNSHVSH